MKLLLSSNSPALTAKVENNHINLKWNTSIGIV